MHAVMEAKIYVLFVLLISSTSFVPSYGANILFYWSFSGYSHRISVWPLVEKLVEKGHNVTFFSPYPPNKPNPKVTEVSSLNAFTSMNMSLDFLSYRLKGGKQAIEDFWPNYFDFGIKNCEGVVNDPEIKNWINNSSFDLIFINSLFNDCGYGLAKKFKAPYIIYGPCAPFGWWSEAYGYPDENFPELQYHYSSQDMTFLQSVWNSLRPLYWQFYRYWYMFPRIEATLKKGLDLPDMPSLSEMERKTSLVLLYTNFIEDYPRSFPPSVIQVGGMHCTDNIKPLPKDLLDFVNSGNGFIYFSFGTYANSGSLPQHYKDIFFKAMGNFTNLKFLVKWHEEITEGNIKTVTWVSQQDVLAHPNIKCFISHGGLLGTMESLYHGVPMVVIPLFADQDYNAERIHSRDRGIKLEIFDLTQEKLEKAILEIVSNSKYKENTEKVSKLFKDIPSKPVDTALWWVEYVLRNGNTSFLHAKGIHKTWYQRRFLDIWGFIALVILFVIISLSFFAYMLFKVISSQINSHRLLKLVVKKKAQ